MGVLRDLEGLGEVGGVWGCGWGLGDVIGVWGIWVGFGGVDWSFGGVFLCFYNFSSRDFVDSFGGFENFFGGFCWMVLELGSYCGK